MEKDAPFWYVLDFHFDSAIMKTQKGAVSRRLVQRYDDKDNRTIEPGRLFLFAQKSNNADDNQTKSKKPLVCNHPHHLPSREVTNRLLCIANRQPIAYGSWGGGYAVCDSAVLIIAWRFLSCQSILRAAGAYPAIHCPAD